MDFRFNDIEQQKIKCFRLYVRNAIKWHKKVRDSQADLINARSRDNEEI